MSKISGGGCFTFGLFLYPKNIFKLYFFSYIIILHNLSKHSEQRAPFLVFRLCLLQSWQTIRT